MESEFGLLAGVYDIDLCAPVLAEGPLDRHLAGAADKVLLVKLVKVLLSKGARVIT